MVWLSSLLWSASIDLPAPSLVVYRLSPVLSRLPVPSRATRSTFPLLRNVFPFRRAPSARRFHPRPCQFSRFVARHPPDFSAPSVPFSRFVARHPPVVSAPPVPFSRFVARFSPDAPVCPSGFPLRRALLVRRLFPSVPSPVLPLFALPAHRSFFLSPCTIVLDEHLCSLAVC